jgi:S1-C subfamily serine protease
MSAHPEPGGKAAARVTSIRRQFRHDIWTDADAQEWTPGGALIHRDGILVGLHTGRSRFGGFTFNRLQTSELNGHLGRMRNGEVFGQWPAGTEPPLGVEMTRKAEGVVVTDATSDGSAAKAGVQKGDVVVKIDGKEVRAIDDLIRHVAEKDAEQEVTLEVWRGTETRQVRMKLPQRMP